jgi:hypothetical protein
VEETEMAVVAIKMVVVVMTMAEKAVVDITDVRGGGRQHIRGNTGL